MRNVLYLRLYPTCHRPFNLYAHPFVGDAMFPYRSYEHLFVIGRYQSGHQIPFNEDEIDHGECSSQQVGKEEQKVTDKMKLSSS